MDLSQMSPRRPYLLRAFYDWLLDNNLTPHLVVDATLPGVQIPQEYVKDGQIILNIAPHAVGNLALGNDEVRFNARFSGVSRQVIAPLYAVTAIYARENGAGTLFEAEVGYQTLQEEFLTDDPLSEPSMVFVDENSVEQTEPDHEPPRPPRGRPALRIIK